MDFTNGVQQVDVLADGAPSAAKTRLIMAHHVIYAMASAATVPTLGGKHWISIDLGSPSATQQPQRSATDALGSLKAVRSVSVVGHETLNGVAVTHYRCVVDERAVFPAMTGVGDAPTEVWIDGSGRLRKQRTTLHISNLTIAGVKASSPDGQATDEMAFSDFGTGIAVVVPQAQDTISFADARKRLGL